MLAESLTLAAGNELGRWRWCVRGELRALQRLLAPDESVECMIGGSTSWLTDALMVATNRRVLFVSCARRRLTRSVIVAYDDIAEIHVGSGRLGASVVVVSDAVRLTLMAYEDDWAERFADAMAARTNVPVTRGALISQPRGDGAVDLGWRQPVSMTIVLWGNALMSGFLGVGFMWAALYPLLGGTRSDPTVLGIGFEGMSTTFELGDAALLVMGVVCGGFALWLAWLSRRGAGRVIASRHGVALRTRGRSFHTWAEIDHFEVGTLLDEGLVQVEEVDGHCAVMVLHGGERIALQALRTWEPFGTHGSADVHARVDTLNSMRLAHHDA